MLVGVAEKLALITEHWSPRTVATVNDYDARLVKVQGEVVRHQHLDTDEFFLVIDGELTIKLDDGVHHRPVSAGLTTLLLIEPTETVNTGDAGGPMTAESTPV